MGKEKDLLEKQINQFYEQSPEVADALPMKDHLLKHENNQMAWYLLGKEYMARGQEAKANYCFKEAGSVYEAFESKANPLLVEPEPKRTKGARRKTIGWLAFLGAGALLAVGLLLPGSPVRAPEAESLNVNDEGSPVPPVKPSTDQSPKPGTSPTGSKGQAGGKSPYSVIAGAADPTEDGRAVLGGLLTSGGKAPSLIIEAPQLGKWTDWLRAGLPVAEVKPIDGAASSAVDWYASGWCPCQNAQDPASISKTVQRWKPTQESKLVLRSAVVHYKERTGKWPTNPAALAGAYPNNTMAGWNEEMNGWIKEMSGESEAGQGSKTAPSTGVPWPVEGGAASEGSSPPGGSLKAMTVQPLEIVIDTTRHRLAVVSGNVLLRNYAVGLGAPKTPTPQGSFTITEKVRNPNGSATGAFGSRGMTLSDTLYAIHGTDEPDSIGKDESHGCVRMKKSDVEELFDLVSPGTKVTITKGGLPSELRIPAERFHLKPAQDETNPRKKYEWLK